MKQGLSVTDQSKQDYRANIPIEGFHNSLTQVYKKEQL